VAEQDALDLFTLAGELLDRGGVGNADLETGLGGVGDTPVEVLVFHDSLSSYPPHGVAALHHNLNFLCKNTRPKSRVFIDLGLQGTILGMNLQQYFSEEPRGAKIEMARHLGITAEWMSKLIAHKAVPSPVLARALEDATGGLVTRKDLRPDLFG